MIHLKCATKKENEYANFKESEIRNESDEETPRRTTRKSLQSLVESLAQKQQFGVERKDFSISEFYKERNPDIFSDKTTINDIQVNLDHINGSSAGVFQTVFKNDEECDDKVDEMKLEVNVN